MQTYQDEAMTQDQAMTKDQAMSEGSAMTTVLIVDDHVMFAEGLARLLDAEPDIEVLGSVSTGAEALERAAKTRPSVAVVDQHLVEGDGTDLVALLHDLDPSIASVLVSGDLGDDVIMEAVRVGCRGFVAKDQPSRDVTNAVRMAARGEVAFPAAVLARMVSRMNGFERKLGDDLTGRERSVLEALTRGGTNQAVADELYLSVHTVRNHVQQILVKLGAHSKLEAVAIAVREGIVRYPVA